MRFPHLSLGLAALIGLLAVPARAQEGGDCDVLCRMSAYLASDHMAAAPAVEPSAPPDARGHRQRPPAHRAPAVAAAAKPAPRAAPAAPERPTTPAAPKAVPAELAAKPPRAPVRAAAAAARPAVPALVARVAPRVPVVAATTVPPKAPAAAPRVASTPAPAAARRHGASGARAAPSAATTRTASLSTTIPGSAPAMQAGFH